MNKSTSMSIILAAMMATSGFAIAQVPSVAGKGDMSAPLPSGNTGNANARADVKADIAGTNTKARTQGEATAPQPAGTPGMANSRADVKAQIGGDLKATTQGEGTPAVAGMPSAASAERKAKRAERRAAAKAKRAAAAEVKTQ